MSGLTVLIIRHGEKPGGSWPGRGITADEAPDEASLVVRGWQRAGSWCALFGTTLGGATYPRPDRIYALPGNTGHASHRSLETVMPLADRLQRQLITTYDFGEEEGLVAEVLQGSGVALICWEHKAIGAEILPRIARGKVSVPEKWDSSRFDVVLRFDLPDEKPPVFRQLMPCLMSGDSITPMPT